MYNRQKENHNKRFTLAERHQCAKDGTIYLCQNLKTYLFLLFQGVSAAQRSLSLAETADGHKW